MKKFIEEFRAFIAKGNVIDMAVAVVVGGAFSKIVSSLVGDIIMPLIGLIAGVLVVFSVEFFDKVAKIDDPVGAISVHGVCGFTGSILVGVFSPEYTLKTQVIGVLSTVAYVLVMAIIVFTIIDKTVGLRVTKGEELDGLDIHEHGCSAYADFNFRL